MSKYQQNDPHADRELEKYEHPIPSREFIIALLKDAATAMNRNDIFAALQLSGETNYDALKRRLRAMERDGQVVFDKNQCYTLPEERLTLRGQVIGHRDGYGWFNVEDSTQKQNDYLITHRHMRHLLHGDTILAQPTGKMIKGRAEVALIHLIKACDTPIVGRFFLEHGKGYVIPDDSRLQKEIYIPDDKRAGARMGHVVIVNITQRNTGKEGFVGAIVEVLGEHMAPGMETQIAIRTHQIPHEWPEDVLAATKDLSETIDETAIDHREDLRHLPLVTIDGEDARDFDDAVYCQALTEGGWRLWVAIADVSHYVTPQSALDKEAILRGNSVYFPSQVIPMLPEVLSNGLCSLNPQVDRLCMVCEMTISERGKLLDYRHYQAVMNSHARLTYNKVNALIHPEEQGEHPELVERYAHLLPHLQQLHALYQTLNKVRIRRGAIEFETVESKFIFNAQYKIDRIEPLIRNDAHKMIEECMILANIASAMFVEKAKAPSLYRIHEPPKEERLSTFRDFLGKLGLHLSGDLEPSPLDYAKLMQEISLRPDKEVIQVMLLRSMRQAIYHADNKGHFGLALKQYAHFTSPIRRYPDLLLHRTIKALLQKDHKASEQTGAQRYTASDMEYFGEQCSMTERRADDATRDVADWLKCEYMQDHLGDELPGVIANITHFGFFVRLTDLHIDGLVHVSSLDTDYYQFDQAGQRLVGERSGSCYRLGDQVVIKVLAVNLENRQIDFGLVTEGAKIRLPKPKGKPKKQRPPRNNKKSKVPAVKKTKAKGKPKKKAKKK